MASARQWIVSVSATLLLGLHAAAFAQSGRGIAADGVRVEGFDVERVPELTSGTRLNFSLFGTPDGEATLQIDGARHILGLREVQPGVYEGSYIIEPQDRIAPRGQVTATLRRGNQVAWSVLDEPLLLDGGAAPAAVPPMAAVAPIEERAPPPARPRIGTPVPLLPAAPACAGCAVVESIRAVDPGDGPGWLGAIAGGLFGAVLGDQVGRGDGRRLARIMGALGGAVAGRELERSGSRHRRYEVVLRLPSGATQTRSYDSAPPFTVGDTVRLSAASLSGGQRSAAPS